TPTACTTNSRMTCSTDPMSCTTMQCEGAFSGDMGAAIDARLGPSSASAGQAIVPGGRIAIDAMGDVIVADTTNHRIRKIDTAGMITTIAGTGTAGYSGDN